MFTMIYLYLLKNSFINLLPFTTIMKLGVPPITQYLEEEETIIGIKTF